MLELKHRKQHRHQQRDLTTHTDLHLLFSISVSLSATLKHLSLQKHSISCPAIYKLLCLSPSNTSNHQSFTHSSYQHKPSFASGSVTFLFCIHHPSYHSPLIHSFLMAKPPQNSSVHSHRYISSLSFSHLHFLVPHPVHPCPTINNLSQFPRLLTL